MTDLDDRVRRALDAQHAPEALRARTLKAIEEARTQQQTAAPVPSEAVRAAAARRRPRRRALAAVAACLILALAGFGLVAAYRHPVAYIGIDVNPSIELAVNCFDIVVAAEPLNDDGRALLEDVSLVGRPCPDALDALAASAPFAAYADAGSLVAVSVASTDAALADRLTADADAALAALPCDHSCAAVDVEVRDQASAAGMGMARYQAAQELVALDPSLTLDECAAMTMRELHDRIDACAGHDDSAEDASSPDAGRGGHGAGGGGGAGHGAGGTGRGQQGAGHGSGHHDGA